MMYLLVLCLLVLVLACFKLFKKDIVSPSFVFTFGFFFQSIWALLNYKEWELDLNLNTFLVVVLDIILFIIVSLFVGKKIDKDEKAVKDSKLDKITIDKWKKTVFLASILIFSIYYLYYIVNSVGGNIFSIKSVSESISEFDRIQKFSNSNIHVPFIIANIRIALIACGYWLIYVIINNYLCDKKVDILLLISIIIAIVLSTFSGSRTTAFFMLGSGVVYFMLLFYKKNKGIVLNKRIIITIVSIGAVLIASFTLFAKVIGRKINTNMFDYLSIYCGAELKNLDTYLQEEHIKKETYFGSQTFYPIIISLGRKLQFEGFHEYKLDLPFRKVGNYNLGNVYTTFYPYIYDFGYIGLPILVAIIALISQFIYNKARNSYNKGYPSISILIYGVVFSCLLLSFFSNKFYENIFTTDFIKKVVVWIMCNWFFCIFKINNKKIIKKRER